MDEQQIERKNQSYRELTDYEILQRVKKYFKRYFGASQNDHGPSLVKKKGNWENFFISLLFVNVIFISLILLLALIIAENNAEGAWAAMAVLGMTSVLCFIPLAIIDIVSIIFYLIKRKTKNFVRLTIKFLGIIFLLFLLLVFSYISLSVYSIYLGDWFSRLVVFISLLVSICIFALSYYLSLILGKKFMKILLLCLILVALLLYYLYTHPWAILNKGV